MPNEQQGVANSNTWLQNCTQNLKWFAAWLGAHVLGGLLPLWGSLILLRLFSRETTLFDYVRNGEFSLYAAALSGTSLFLILRGLPTTPPRRMGFGIVSVLCLAVSTILFAGVFISTRLTEVPDALPPLNLHWLAWLSIAFYILALVTTLWASRIDDRTSFDVRKIPQDDFTELASRFRTTRGTNG